MHKQRIWLAIICAAGLFAAMLPWVNIFIIGVSGLDLGWPGWAVIGLFAAAGGAVLTGTRTEPIDQPRKTGLAAIGAGAIGIGVLKVIEISKGTIDLGKQLGSTGDGELGGVGREMGREMGKMFGEMVSVGMGLYLLIAAGVALIVVAMLKPKPAA